MLYVSLLLNQQHSRKVLGGMLSDPDLSLGMRLGEQDVSLILWEAPGDKELH